MTFSFLDTDDLRGDGLVLRLTDARPGDDASGRVPCYYFDICLAATGAPIGETDLRVGHNESTWYGGNIGYSVDPPHRGNHTAEKACRLLFTLAARHGMGYLIITCNPDNGASRRTCERLGGTLLTIADLPPDTAMYRSGERQKCIFRFELGQAQNGPGRL